MRKSWSNLYLVLVLLLYVLPLAGCSDGGGGGTSAGSVDNQATPLPVAEAGNNLAVALGTPVTLDGSGSHGVSNHTLTYRWTLITKPSGSSAALSRTTTATPELVSDVDGVYVAQLVVRDGTADSLADTVTVTAKSAAGVLDPTFGGDLFPADGTPDGFVIHNNAAGGNNYDYGYAMTLDQAGRVYLTGSSGGADDYPHLTLWRYTRDGVLDTTFGGGQGFVVVSNGPEGDHELGMDIILDQAGRVYVVSNSLTPVGNSEMVLWRFTNDGVRDTTFGEDLYPLDGLPDGFAVFNRPPLASTGSSLQFDQAGRIYISGVSYTQATGFCMTLWRYIATGTLDTTFGGGEGFVVMDHGWGVSMALDPAGRLYLTGSRVNAAGNDDMTLLRYTADGILDTSFGDGKGFVVHDSAAEGNGDDWGVSLALDSSGRVYVTGSSDNAASNADMVVWRYSADGILDSSFGNGKGFVVHNNAAGGNSRDLGESLVLDGVGRVYVTGISMNPAGSGDMVIWRYTNAGILDSSFGNGKGFVVHSNAPGGIWYDGGYSLALDGIGRVYVTGALTNAAGNGDMALWRYE